MLQSVKAITCLLLGAETLEVRTAVKQLGDTLRIVNDKVYDETKFIQLMDDFQNAMENLCNGVRNLITMYCATFHVTFSPSGAPARCREIKEVTQSLENILVHIGSVHRIPAHIRHRFDHFKVIVSLYYAGKKVIEHTDTDVYSTLENPLTGDTIYFDQWLELTDFPMCLVPLETRVVFTLCSMNTSQPVGGSGSNVPHKWNNIGWVAFMLFDFKRNVTQGGKLLSLWQGVANPLGATCSNIFQPNTTLLQVNLTDFGFDLRFPAALIDSAQLHRPQLGGGGTNPHIPDGDLKELNDILSKRMRLSTLKTKSSSGRDGACSEILRKHFLKSCFPPPN
ncbi:PIK3C2A [Bugula neritina]|uniref:PIK3C2A n=1 Tax=Bugula neritina TaxID=10212 RepID=A0A7J7KPA5_BUGNE|nr:PIK3C2A [Bugula neritina]